MLVVDTHTLVNGMAFHHCNCWWQSCTSLNYTWLIVEMPYYHRDFQWWVAYVIKDEYIYTHEVNPKWGGDGGKLFVRLLATLMWLVLPALPNKHARLHWDAQSWLGKCEACAVFRFLNTKSLKPLEIQRQVRRCKNVCKCGRELRAVRRWFCSDEEVKDEVRRSLTDLAASWYDSGILKLPQRRQKCINQLCRKINTSSTFKMT